MKVTIGFLAMFLSSSVFAETATTPDKQHEEINLKCTSANLVRSIEVTYSAPGKPVPCAVTYSKTTEKPGSHEDLWHSANDPEFCIQKAKGFAEKLKGLGWTCETQATVSK